MENSGPNNSEKDDDDDELTTSEQDSSKKKRNLPSRFKDFLQSWMDKTPAKNKESEAEKDGDDHNWLKSFGDITLKLFGEEHPENLEPPKAEAEVPSDIVEPAKPEAAIDTHAAAEEMHTVYDKQPEQVQPQASTSETVQAEASAEPAIANPENQSADSLTKTQRPETLASDSASPTLVYERGHLVHPEAQTANDKQTVETINYEPSHREKLRQKDILKNNKTLEKQQRETLKSGEKLHDKYEELQKQIKQVAKKLELPDRRYEYAPNLPPPAEAPPIFINKANLQPKWAGPEAVAASANAKTSPEKLKQMVASPETFAKNPETILHQVEKAAEKNIPIEKLYERRQEVKDNNDAFTSSRSLGNNAGWLKPSVPPELVVPKPRGLPKINKLADIWKEQPPIYQQAVKNSAGAALLVVVVAALLMVAFR